MPPAPLPTPRCPTCGAFNPSSRRACLQCGAALTGSPPAPTAAARPGHALAARRELWIGLVLVLVVLGYVSWDTAHQADQAATYRKGTQAAATADWDRAAAAFGQLGDYYDAPTRLATARTQIQQRDASYRRGVAATARQEWLEAYRAFSETLTIQPTYSDTHALYSQASTRAVAAALAGTVYRQATGAHPGLYLTGPEGGPAVYLPGSDAQSQLVGSNSVLGRVIYDGPRPGTLPRPGPPPPPGQTPALDADRQLWLAGPDAHAPVALPPEDGPVGLWVPTRQGAWAVGLGETADWWEQAVTLPPGAAAALRYGLWVSFLHYFDASTGTTTSRTPIGTALVLGGAPPDGLLLGIYDLSAAVHQTQIVVVTPEQATPQVLTTVAGVVYWAQLNSAGDALAYVYGANGPTRAVSSLNLAWIDLSSPPRPPQPLVTVALSSDQPLNSLQATWGAGLPWGQLLVRQIAGPQLSLSGVDLGTGTVQRLWSATQAEFLASTVAGEQAQWTPDGQAAVFFPPTVGTPRRLSWQPRNAALAAVVFAPLPTAAPVQQVAMARDGVTFGVLQIDFGVDQGNTPPPARTWVSRLSLSHPEAAPSVLYQSDGQDAHAVPFFLPSGVLAWPATDGLHLRLLEGTGDLPVLPGVDEIRLLRSRVIW